MGFERNRFETDVLPLRIESDRILAPSEVAGLIENFVQTPEGTLESVRGPAPWVPDYGGGLPTYGEAHGIFHTSLLGGGREVLLLVDGDPANPGFQRVSVFRGHSAAGGAPWFVLAAPSGGDLTIEVPSDRGPQFPAQFEATPIGVVIVPQRGRALFYDGITVLPLGYDQAPAPPFAQGPESTGSTVANANIQGYRVLSGAPGGVGGHQLHEDFGRGRLGTVATNMDGAGANGVIRGEWQYALQWIDRWGNLSPLSPRSNLVHIDTKHHANAPEELQHEFLVENIENGPEGTIGKILCRTQDRFNLGDGKLLEVPKDVGAPTSAAFATLPDNVTKRFPDNVPDSWLVTEPHDPVPVPQFKLCRLAFGRLWIANTPDDPGILMASMVGRYGTFEREHVMFPDARGDEITGLWATRGGLLAFTRVSTFLITPDDSGQQFRASTLHPGVGCAAPSSLADLPDGSVVWLGRDGFYRFDGQGIEMISWEIQETIDRLNRSRLLQACAAYDFRSREYRCWVPSEGSRENDLCLVYGGDGWRRRTDAQARSVCVTRDHLRYMITAGRATEGPVVPTVRDGVWLLDHEVQTFQPLAREARIETAWIEALRSRGRKTPKTVWLWLRETDDSALTVEVQRDWRRLGTAPYSDSLNGTLRLDEDVPATWGTTRWDQTTAPNTWIRRRPFWKRVHIDAPSAETYKIIFRTTARMEFIGLLIGEQPQATSGRTP